MKTPDKKRPLIPCGGDDRVYTPPALAERIVNHFKPTGKALDPCRGKGAFQNLIPNCDWCEIDEGIDFLGEQGHWDWIVTNPPWSQFRSFLVKSMQVADNVVFLVTLNHFFTKARLRDMRSHGFGFVEALLVDTPPSPWPQSGFQLAAVHIQKGFEGTMSITN